MTIRQLNTREYQTSIYEVGGFVTAQLIAENRPETNIRRFAIEYRARQAIVEESHRDAH